MNALTVRVFLVGVGNESAVIRSDAVDGVIVRDPVVIVVFITVISNAVVIRVKLRAVWNVGAVISSVLVSVSITENTQHSTLWAELKLFEVIITGISNNENTRVIPDKIICISDWNMVYHNWSNLCVQWHSFIFQNICVGFYANGVGVGVGICQKTSTSTWRGLQWWVATALDYYV